MKLFMRVFSLCLMLLLICSALLLWLLAGDVYLLLSNLLATVLATWNHTGNIHLAQNLRATEGRSLGRAEGT